MKNRTFIKSLLLLSFLTTLLYSTPRAPSHLHIEATIVGVALTWQDNSDDERGFKIFRDEKFLAFLPPNSTSYIDKSVAPNVMYRYKVRASDDLSDNILNDVSLRMDGSALVGELDGRFAKDSHFSIYIDSDNNSNTGYSNSALNIRGADHLLQGNSLYRVNSDNRHWDRIGDARIERTSTKTTLAITASRIPLSSTIRYTGVVTSNDWNHNTTFKYMKRLMTDIDSGVFPIVIIGPSTVNQDYGYTPEHYADGSECKIVGWGETFDMVAKNNSIYFNYARAGAGAGSFLLGPNLGPNGETNHWSLLFGPDHNRYWAKTKEKMQELGHGILLLQFGGNDKNFIEAAFPIHIDNNWNKPIVDRNGDGVGDEKDRAIARDLQRREFEKNLKFYINEARALNFTPIMITSPASKLFVDNQINLYREPFPSWMKALGEREGVRVLDLFEKSREEYGKYQNQENLEAEFGLCYFPNDAPDRNHFYDREHAGMVAGWVRDLACQEPDSKLCSQLRQ